MDARFLGIAELAEVPSVAVVVDVMRAFTVAAWAFAQGAEQIVLAESLDDTLALRARHPGWVALKDGPPAIAERQTGGVVLYTSDEDDMVKLCTPRVIVRKL